MSSLVDKWNIFSSSPFPNAGFPDEILKYACRAKRAAGLNIKNGNIHTAKVFRMVH